MLDKKHRILGIIVLILGFLMLFSKEFKAQSVVKNGNTFVEQQKKSDSVKSGPTKTKYTFVDSNGNVDTVYLSSKGSAFVWKVSKKTGKRYRRYLPEVTKAIGSNVNKNDRRIN